MGVPYSIFCCFKSTTNARLLDLEDGGTGTYSTDVNTMLASANNAAIRSAIGVGTTDAPTFLAQTLTNGTITSGTGVVNLTGRVVPTGVFGIDGAGGTIEIFNDLAAAQARTITARAASFGRTGIAYRADAILGWTAGNGSSTDGGNLGTADTILARDAPGILAQRNGSATQAFRVYNDYGGGVNFSRFGVSFSGGVLNIGAEKGGTGTNLGVAINSLDGVAIHVGNTLTKVWNFAYTGHLLAALDGFFDIGASGANRPRNLYLGGILVLASQGHIQAGNGTTYLSAHGETLSGASNYIKSTNSNPVIIGTANAESFLFSGGATPLMRLGGTTDSFPAIARDGAGIKITGAATGSTSWIKVPAVAVSALPSAATAGVGARSFVNDALAPTFGSAVTGGGAVTVPVYSTGSAWNVG